MQNGKQQYTTSQAYRFEARGEKGQVEAILVPRLRKMVAKEEWQLGDREYRDHNANLLFELITSTSVKVLWLDFNKRPTIIQEIALPIYTHLSILYMGDNNVASISSLTMIDAPVLQKLFLNHNKITCLKALAMSHFPALTDLNLNGNLIADESWLSLTHFPKLQRLSLGYLNKKQQIWEQTWYVKSVLNDQTTIQSPKAKLGIFTPKLIKLQQPKLVHKTSHQRNLFKTFQT